MEESQYSNTNISGQRIMRWMLVSLLSGLMMAGTGIYLLSYTDITSTMGLTGLGIVVALISLGLLLVVPAKIYIILSFTRYEIIHRETTDKKTKE